MNMEARMKALVDEMAMAAVEAKDMAARHQFYREQMEMALMDIQALKDSLDLMAPYLSGSEAGERGIGEKAHETARSLVGNLDKIFNLVLSIGANTELSDEAIGELRVYPEVCRWHQVPDDLEAWESECGSALSFQFGGPQDNGARYCPGCGKLLEAHGADEPMVEPSTTPWDPLD